MRRVARPRIKLRNDPPETGRGAEAARVPASPRKPTQCKPNALIADVMEVLRRIPIVVEVADPGVDPNVAGVAREIDPNDHDPKIADDLDPVIVAQDQDLGSENVETVRNETVNANDEKENEKSENDENKNGKNDAVKKIVKEKGSENDKRNEIESEKKSDVSESWPKSGKTNSGGNCKKRRDNEDPNMNPAMTRKVKLRPLQSLRMIPPRDHHHLINGRICHPKGDVNQIPLRLEVANHPLTLIVGKRRNPMKFLTDDQKPNPPAVLDILPKAKRNTPKTVETEARRRHRPTKLDPNAGANPTPLVLNRKKRSLLGKEVLIDIIITIINPPKSDPAKSLFVNTLTVESLDEAEETPIDKILNPMRSDALSGFVPLHPLKIQDSRRLKA